MAIARQLNKIETDLQTALVAEADQRQLKLEALVAKHVDLGYLTARCLDGMRGIDRRARARISAWLGGRLVRQLQKLSPAGDDPKGPPFTISQGEQRLKGRLATVALTWNWPDRSAAPLDVELRRRKGRWRLWDVRAAGINILRRYRSHFRAQLRKGGQEALLEGMASPVPDATTAGKKRRPLH